jgi:hypothetical protein
MIEQICQECGHRLSFPNQYAGTARSCHFCGAIVSLPETLPPSARVPNAAQKSVRMKRATGPFGLDRNYLIFAGVFFGFSLLLCITGFLAGGTGEPFSITVFVLGFVVLVTSAAGTIMAVYDVDILSEWTRASFTLGNALLLFLPCGALGALTTVFTYSP